MKTLLTALLLGLFGVGLSYDPVTLTGCVTDTETGEPLIGVSILIKGTSQGTITDVNGCFTLTSAEAKPTLVVSYTGYETVELKRVSDKEQLQIQMQGGMALEEVVVTGLGIRRESQSTASVSRAPDNKDRRARKKNRPKTYNATASAPPPPPPPPALQRTSVRGSRAQTTDYYIDSKRVEVTAEDTAHDPTAIGEGYDRIDETPFINTQNEHTSTFSIDVDASSYSNVRRFLNNRNAPPPDAVRIEEMINYFDYDYPNPTDEHPFHVTTELAPCPWQPDHRLLHIGIQGQRMAMTDLPTNNFVFLLDVSGSMNAHNKLPLLKQSLHLMVDNLREEDKVSMVVYAGAAGLVLPPTSGKDKAAIREALDKLSAGGSTAGGAGIQLAYQTAREQFIEDGNNRVILATDGDFNVGVSSSEGLVDLIERERESGIFLTVLGFGQGNLQDGKMQQLADKGNGNHAYIDNLDEARKVLVTEFGGTTFTIAKDVKLQLHFNPATVAGYRLIGYENRLLANEDFDDDTKDAGELGAGHSVTALYEIIPAGVTSDYLAGTDKLPATKTAPEKASSFSAGEFCQLKLRYKQPQGSKSQLLTHPVTQTVGDLGQASLNFRWSAAVAEFGLLLRGSAFKGQADYKHCQAFAESAIGRDPFGYRRQMIKMIEVASTLGPVAAER